MSEPEKQGLTLEAETSSGGGDHWCAPGCESLGLKIHPARCGEGPLRQPQSQFSSLAISDALRGWSPSCHSFQHSGLCYNKDRAKILVC